MLRRMTDQPKLGTPGRSPAGVERAAARFRKEATALRANLHKRREQLRGRASLAKRDGRAKSEDTTEADGS